MTMEQAVISMIIQFGFIGIWFYMMYRAANGKGLMGDK